MAGSEVPRAAPPAVISVQGYVPAVDRMQADTEAALAALAIAVVVAVQRAAVEAAAASRTVTGNPVLAVGSNRFLSALKVSRELAAAAEGLTGPADASLQLAAPVGEPESEETAGNTHAAVAPFGLLGSASASPLFGRDVTDSIPAVVLCRQCPARVLAVVVRTCLTRVRPRVQCACRRAKAFSQLRPWASGPKKETPKGQRAA